jgi:hypothetical protein
VDHQAARSSLVVDFREDAVAFQDLAGRLTPDDDVMNATTVTCEFGIVSNGETQVLLYHDICQIFVECGDESLRAHGTRIL